MCPLSTILGALYKTKRETKFSVESGPREKITVRRIRKKQRRELRERKRARKERQEAAIRAAAMESERARPATPAQPPPLAERTAAGAAPAAAVPPAAAPKADQLIPPKPIRATKEVKWFAQATNKKEWEAIFKKKQKAEDMAERYKEYRVGITRIIRPPLDKGNVVRHCMFLYVYKMYLLFFQWNCSGDGVVLIVNTPQIAYRVTTYRVDSGYRVGFSWNQFILTISIVRIVLL